MLSLCQNFVPFAGGHCPCALDMTGGAVPKQILAGVWYFQGIGTRDLSQGFLGAGV